MLQQLLAVFLVLGLLGCTLWLLRRKGLAKLNLFPPKRMNRARELQIIDRVALTAHHSLHLVQVKDRVMLIGVSPSSCTQLESFPVPASEAL